MKRLILFVFLLSCGSVFASNTLKKSINKEEYKSHLYKQKRYKQKLKIKKPLCHICCSVTVFNGNGMGSTVTACAGWLLTSCETAAERACHRAEVAAEEILNPGG